MENKYTSREILGHRLVLLERLLSSVNSEEEYHSIFQEKLEVEKELNKLGVKK
jgi:hypothetical protein